MFSVYEQAREIDDDSVIARAVSEDRVLITNDKDFGENVYREKHIHKGIVLLRLPDENASSKVAAVRGLVEFHIGRLEGSFVVVTDKQVRFARL